VTKKWAGKPAVLEALKNDCDLRQAIISEIKKRDVAGLYVRRRGRAGRNRRRDTPRRRAPKRSSKLRPPGREPWRLIFRKATRSHFSG
jgi:hypothetical protein